MGKKDKRAARNTKAAKKKRALNKNRPAGSRMRRTQSSTESGVFIPFHEKYPLVADSETRVITLLQENRGVPMGEYGFVDTYCADPSCDCRRTIFIVFRRESDDSPPKHVLSIGYGWETASFYQRWMGDDLGFASKMKGPMIEPNSPLCPYGGELLELFVELCISSPEYVERIKRHYKLFKEA